MAMIDDKLITTAPCAMMRHGLRATPSIGTPAHVHVQGGSAAVRGSYNYDEAAYACIRMTQKGRPAAGPLQLPWCACAFATQRARRHECWQLEV